MQDFFQYLEAQRGRETDAVLLYWALRAFRDSLKSGQLVSRGSVRRIHELLRFCDFEELGPWLGKRRPALTRIIEFARRNGQDEVVRILESALEGIGADFSEFTAVELEQFSIDPARTGELDWSGVEMRLSLEMDGLQAAVLNKLQSARGKFDLPLPHVLQRKFARQQRATALAANVSALSLFERLLFAGKPRMEARGGEGADTQRVVLEVEHRSFRQDYPHLVEQARERYSPHANALLEIYARCNGADLFVHAQAPGLCLAGITEWEELLERQVSWLEQVDFQDDPDSIPAWLRSSIAFAFTPGDHEAWLLLTEGPHAGKVMLSITDLVEADQPRYASLAEFFATLVQDAPSIIGNGGFVRYVVDGEELGPHRYFND